MTTLRHYPAAQSLLAALASGEPQGEIDVREVGVATVDALARAGLLRAELTAGEAVLHLTDAGSRVGALLNEGRG